MKKLLLFVIYLSMNLSLMATELKSPDGNLVLIVEVKDGVATYRLDYKGKAVIKQSNLGLELKKDQNLI